MRTPNPHHESCPIAPFAHPLVIQFFAILKARNLAMTDVADKAGTSLTCLVKWKRKHTPTIEKFEKAANAIGYELKMMPREGESMGTQKLEKLVRFQLEFSAPNGKTEQLELYLNHEQIEDGYVCDVPSAPNDSLKITKIRVSVVSSLVGETVG